MTRDRERTHGLEPLLRPRSIAVLGATGDADDLATTALTNLRANNFGGVVRTIDAIDELSPADPVDILITVRPPGGPGRLARAAAGRARSAVITHGERTPLSVPGIRILGPNSLGVVNVAARSAAIVSFNIPPGLEPGHLALVSQSGAVATTALLRATAAGVRFNLVAATGSEADITIGEVVAAAAAEPDTRAIALYIEGLRDPRSLFAAAAGVPIVVLRGGRTRAGRQAALTHSGAVANEERLLSAALRHHGIAEAHSLDGWWAAAAALARRGRPRGRRVAIVSPSGGLTVLLADGAADRGLEMARLSQPTRARLRALIPAACPSNPFECTGRVLTDSTLLARTLETFLSDPAVDIGLFVVNAMAGERGARGAGVIAALPAELRPHITTFVDGGAATAATTDALRDARLDALRDVDCSLDAANALAQAATVARVPRPPRLPGAITAAARALFAGRRPDEVLAGLGVPLPKQQRAGSATSATAAADEVGYPVAVKTTAPGHKLREGKVALDLRSAAEVQAAATRIGGEVLVQSMVRPRAELLIGALVDRQLGPFVVVGVGGSAVEDRDDVAVAVAPVTTARARALIAGLRVPPAGDLEAAAKIVALLSRVAAGAPADFGVLEVNPLAIFDRGVAAIDVRYAINATTPAPADRAGRRGR